jgi:hypothetical protein
MPRVEVDEEKAKPLLNEAPKFMSVSTMGEEMGNRFQAPHTKRTIAPFGHPLFCNRSEVHRRFWRASQAKNLTFGGAQIFQTSLFIVEAVDPKNCAM